VNRRFKRGKPLQSRRQSASAEFVWARFGSSWWLNRYLSDNMPLRS
jgi:hypothetical protein